MFTYLLKRILLLIPTFIGITLVTFFVVKLAPGDPVSLKLAFNEGVKAEVIAQAALAENAAIVLPPWLQSRLDQWPKTPKHVAEWVCKNSVYYAQWFQKIVMFDFGNSSKDGRPVLDRIAEALPITLFLNLITIVIVYTLSVPIGVWSALRRHTAKDSTVMLVLFILYSLPSFWVAILLLMFFASGEYFDWFPLTGFASETIASLPWYQQIGDVFSHLVLPIFCLTYGSFAFLSRFSRTTFLDVARQDYMRTAQAKGLSWKDVVWRHGFRNTLIPLLTLMGTLLPALIGGSVIIEAIFGIPGMGRLGFEAVLSRDRNLIMGIATLSSFLTLFSLLLTDLLYAWVDPRVSFGGTRA